ncbi:MAG: hypothetical protein H6833_11850, partial [Planctomycetes bacterium]|nr:hypothetical protein [Planctomycetota bacterium]
MACGPGGGGGGAGLFKIDSCTLGCRSNGNCSINQVALNEEIKLRFNAPVSASSVTRSTFSVIDRATGLEPTAIFVVSGQEVFFRPQITFDSSGSPVFGLQQGSTYILRIPGLDQSAGGTIRSTDGRRNGREYRCEITASQGINDPRPGPPSVEVFLERDPDNAPGVLESLDNPPANAAPVELEANVVLVFNELMNPSTLVNPVTQTSGFLSFKVDVDGDLQTTNDQRDLPSRYSISLDQQALTTTVRIDPVPLMPGPGSGAQPRLMFVSFSSGIKDLAGNDLTNPSPRSFVTESVSNARFELVETFQGNGNEDPERTSARWNPSALGYLEQGPGGGSGLLGDLTPSTAGVVTIDVTNYTAPLTETLTGVDETVTDGVFYFTKIDIPRDVTVQLVGSRIAQIYAASANIRGSLLVGGEDAPAHRGVNNPCLAGVAWPVVATGWGGDGGIGGPAAGNGGHGGDDPRPDELPAGGMPRTAAPRTVDGANGGGIGGTGTGGGFGSVAYPATAISNQYSAR